MAKVEIDEAQLQGMQRAVALLEKLNNSPKARSHLEKAVKAEFPDVKTQDEQIEEIAAPHVAKINEAVEALNKRMADMDARERKIAEDEADNKLIAAFGRLKGQGYTEEGLAKIAGLMTERRIADPEAAAALFDRMNPKPPPEVPGAWEPQNWNIDQNAVTDTAALFKDEERWADAEVGRVLQDVRGQANRAA